jgi:hypothetical protein
VADRSRVRTAAHRVVFRHDLAAVATVAWAVLAAAVVSTSPVPERPALAAGGLAVGLVGLALGWVPAVVVDDDGVTVVNPWTTVRIGWAAVRDVRMGWTLTITTDDATRRAWAVPGPRRMRSMWERHETGFGKAMERRSLDDLAAAAARGEGALGLGDATLVVAQRWAARAALCPVSPVATTATTPSRALLVAAAVAAATAALLAG